MQVNRRRFSIYGHLATKGESVHQPRPQTTQASNALILSLCAIQRSGRIFHPGRPSQGQLKRSLPRFQEHDRQDTARASFCHHYFCKWVGRTRDLIARALHLSKFDKKITSAKKLEETRIHVHVHVHLHQHHVLI